MTLPIEAVHFPLLVIIKALVREVLAVAVEQYFAMLKQGAQLRVPEELVVRQRGRMVQTDEQKRVRHEAARDERVGEVMMRHRRVVQVEQLVNVDFVV